MTTFSRAAARTSEPAGIAALPTPPELPAGLACRPRVLELISADSVSLGCGSDQDVRQCLDVAQATARALDPQARIRCAASAGTAIYHLDLLTASENNQWSVSRRPGAARQVLLEQMRDLADARLTATGPGRKRQRRAGHADLVVLVGQEPLYAAPVRRLRLLGIPTWLLVPGHQVDPRLYAYACAVSFLGPDHPDKTTSGQLPPASARRPFVQGDKA
jgi:hypothetical protein